MVSNITVSYILSFREDYNCRIKQHNFLHINPTDTLVLKFHMILLYIYHQTVSKQYFLVGEGRFQSYVYFRAWQKQFWAKII